ncbi:hypothetical protein MTBSS4_110055 [Magnetospirillum sp. SS-4]|nr:hypothetical protein MTBSS4_110055 [Magnetospirillum sp. SS-4]
MTDFVALVVSQSVKRNTLKK